MFQGSGAFHRIQEIQVMMMAKIMVVEDEEKYMARIARIELTHILFITWFIIE